MDNRPPFGANSEDVDRLLALGLERPGTAGQSSPMAPLADLLETPGSQIDRYKLLEVLGEGGMGIVYLAEQQEPIRRQVALKIIKPGMDSKRVLARFETEQQALALMEHPHIARVYDAGLAPSGRPYFVMEHVKGLPITVHCDERWLIIEERLHLFLHVCAAVQHAHQKGIIHRDLKPSNILVTVQDQEVVPKVIDFGVARAISQPPTERTLHTDQGQPIGTPEYMSPEQANPAHQDIDTRTDIYSLGVVLYELLTGVLPFDRQTFRAGGIEHIRKVICEEDPKTPSTRLSKTSVEESAASARRRQTDLRTLQRRLRGDLDWITLRALEKDRSRRYATVDALATDIRNYLHHEPVSAAPPGAVYRAGKFVRRHRQVLALAGGAGVLLLVMFWAGLVHLQAGRERTRAEALEQERILAQARDLFNSRGTRAQTASDASSGALTMIEPLMASRYVGPRAQLLHATILVEYRYYDEAAPRLEKLLDGPPEIAGAAYALLARILWEGPSLGPDELKRAEAYQKKAEELLPKTPEAYYLRAMATLGIHEKLDLLEEALRLDSNHYESRRLRALTYQASRQYKLLYNDTVVMMHLRPRDPSGYFLHAIALMELGDYEGAIKCYGDAVGLTPRDHPQYIEWNGRRCEALLRMGDYERVITEAQACTSRVGAKDVSPLQYPVFCALTALGRYEEASALFRRVTDAERAAGTQAWYVGTNLKSWSMKYVFDTLEAGRPWHPPDRKPEGPAFLAMLEAEETYRNLSAKARRLITGCFGGSWSPDGTKIAFSAGVYGSSGVAVYNLKSKELDLLTIPGLDPVWSPDGQYIAYLRTRAVLRLSEFTAGAPRSALPGRTVADAEVRVMKADGTQPRRVARGARWPEWSQDAKRLYYHSIVDKMLYAVPIDNLQARPTPLLSTAVYPSVSPDDSQVARIEGRVPLVTGGVLTIMDLARQSVVTEWSAPLAIWGGKWSPDGREFNFGGANAKENRTGLWVYDRDKGEAAKVLSGQIVGGSRSPDKTRMIIYVGPPYYEIWLAALDPNRPTIEALAPAQTVEEHCIESIARCNRELAVDPNLFASHWERSASAVWIDDDRASHYLEELDHACDRQPPQPQTYQNHAAWILASSALRDRLGPLALVLARKAVAQNPVCVKDLAHLLYHVGQQNEAVRLWQMAQVPILEGSCRYDAGSDTYTIGGSGADIWGTVDDFHFARKRLQGDGSITARIESVENVHELTKAGVMIRHTLEPDCPNVMMLVTPSGILSFQRRAGHAAVTGNTSTPTNSIQTPQWLRLIRQGNRFTARHSSDGITWEDVLFGSDQQVTFDVPMEETVYIGLAVTSHDIARTAEAHISHVTTTGSVSPLGPFTESQDIRFQLSPSRDVSASGK